MDMNKIELSAIAGAANDGVVEAVKELSELQLGQVGGGIEVSFH